MGGKCKTSKSKKEEKSSSSSSSTPENAPEDRRTKLRSAQENSQPTYNDPQTSGMSKDDINRFNISDSCVVNVLNELEDDVQQGYPMERQNIGDETEEVKPQDEPVESVYIQRRKGFDLLSKEDISKIRSDHALSCVDMNPHKGSLTPLEFAILLHHVTRQFFSFCHGLLGGFALCHIILVIVIVDDSQSIYNFAHGYPSFARSVHIIYYILATLCFISVLDRCDFAHLDLLHCGDLVRYRLADLLLIIIYFCVLVTTLICTRWDDRLALQPYDWGLWLDPEESRREFGSWRIISLVRGALAVAGYITLFFASDDDLFYVHLCNMIKYQDQPVEYTAGRY